MEKINDILDERQLKEIELATFYSEKCLHGTDGHHRLTLIYQLYKHIKNLEWFIDENNK